MSGYVPMPRGGGRWTVNDDEREMWVLNDEGLYLWWTREDPDEKHLRRFVKRNRSEIDAVIRANQ